MSPVAPLTPARALVNNTRHQLHRALRIMLENGCRFDWFRRGSRKLTAEIDRALTETGTYGGKYFGKSRNPLDRMGLSGYERYDRDTSNANAIALPIWKYFAPQKALDVGCATGFVVEALTELGIDAYGTDLSYWAVEHPAKGAKGRLQQGNVLQGLPFATGEFDLVTCLEILEHLPPDQIPRTLTELRRISSGYVVATIPSIGDNAYGPGGWYDLKVRPEVLDEYRAKGPNYRGPVPPEDLYLDKNGEPIEGHICIASFAWWEEQFANAGFERCGETELLMHHDLARYAQTEYWNLYVFRVPTARLVTAPIRTKHEVEHWEHNFGLDKRDIRERDVLRLNEALVRNHEEPLSLRDLSRR